MAGLKHNDSDAEAQAWGSLQSAVDGVFEGEPKYPDGTVIVPADMPGLADVLREQSSRGPVVVVYEDGREEFVVKGRERFADVGGFGRFGDGGRWVRIVMAAGTVALVVRKVGRAVTRT